MATKDLVLKPEQIRVAFNHLPKMEQLRLIKVFERSTWSDRFTRLLQRIRRRAQKYPPISEEEIVRTCREVRQDLYDITHRRRRP